MIIVKSRSLILKRTDVIAKESSPAFMGPALLHNQKFKYGWGLNFFETEKLQKSLSSVAKFHFNSENFKIYANKGECLMRYFMHYQMPYSVKGEVLNYNLPLILKEKSKLNAETIYFTELEIQTKTNYENFLKNYYSKWNPNEKSK